MKYFIIQGLLPEVRVGSTSLGFRGTAHESGERRLRDWARRYGPTQPVVEGERPVLHVPSLGRISIFVHDVWTAHLLVVARSQEKAYRLASPFRGFVTVYLGYPRQEGLVEYLVELMRKPASSDSTHLIVSNYLHPDVWPDDYEHALSSGTMIYPEQMEAAAAFVGQVLQSDQSQLSLRYLERSHYLLSGSMTASYYHAHYVHERSAQSAYLRRKTYLEMSTLYDLAFLSAFRALEALLGCGARSLDRGEIPARLRELDSRFGSDFCTDRWRSLHHVFTTHRRYWPYEEIIAVFLETRNAVAAHANPSPPFPLSEDQVFELQNLVQSMLYRVTVPEGD